MDRFQRWSRNALLLVQLAQGNRREMSMAQGRIPYLELDPSIEAAIREDRAAGWKNPCAFKDENVIRREDKAHDRATLTRPAFARDIEKIINIPAYNRYADKTQVFSLVENDDICRRGLHVQQQVVVRERRQRRRRQSHGDCERAGRDHARGLRAGTRRHRGPGRGARGARRNGRQGCQGY